jgi:pimeloyl-ACP methyl ester carboxylesterase
MLCHCESYSRTLQNVIFTSHAQAWIQETTRPILIIQGKHDRIAPIENVQLAIDQLPHVRLIAFESGHRLVFTHSAAITAEITRFLQGNGHV